MVLLQKNSHYYKQWLQTNAILKLRSRMFIPFYIFFYIRLLPIIALIIPNGSIAFPFLLNRNNRTNLIDLFAFSHSGGIT